MKPRAYAVILAGGRGERFWPLSTRRRPKQLLALVGRRALLAQAVDRIRPLVPASRVIVVTSADIRGAVRRLLPAVPAGQVIGEPRGRDTAAAIAAGAALIRARDPGAVFCVLTADQVISREAVFRRTLKELFARAAAGDVLLTIGLKPEFPSTGFGYIEAGARLPGRSAAAMYRVRRFVEKPGRALAARYVKAGRYYWNSGMFVWSLASWTRALERYAPALARLQERLAAQAGRPGFRETLARSYARLPKISVDYAILEKAGNIEMAAGGFGWDDVGSWSALQKHFKGDPQGNVVIGRGEVLDAADNIVLAESGLVALLGVRGLVAVQAGGVTLVCAKERVQDVKRLVAQVGRRPGGGAWL